MSSGDKAQPGIQGVITSRRDFMNTSGRKHLRAHRCTRTSAPVCTHHTYAMYTQISPLKEKHRKKMRECQGSPTDREEAKEQADCGHKTASVEALVGLEAAIMFWARLSVRLGQGKEV